MRRGYSKRTSVSRRPSRHIRRVHTKYGHKPRVINRHIRKRVSRPTISTAQRKIFRAASDPKQQKVEYGGAIDFGFNGRIEEIQMIPGMTHEVALPSDFEVIYHTHPDPLGSPPTPEDVIALLDDKRQQAEIIFRDGRAFIITKTEASRALGKKSRPEQRRILNGAFNASEGPNWEKKFAQRLRKLGFDVAQTNKKTGPLRVNVKILEPGQ